MKCKLGKNLSISSGPPSMERRSDWSTRLYIECLLQRYQCGEIQKGEARRLLEERKISGQVLKRLKLAS